MERRSIDDIWGLPLRKAHNKIYFFNSDGICEVLPTAKFLDQYDTRLKELGKSLWSYGVHLQDDDIFHMTYADWRKPGMSHFTQSIYSAGVWLTPGDTLDDYFHYIEECQAYYDYVYECRRQTGRVYPMPKGLDRFVTKIDRPNFIRYPENSNKYTFDMIKLTVYTVSTWEEDKLKYFKANMMAIYHKVLDKLVNSKVFQKYNVPAGCLALTDVFYVGGDAYEFVFELKQELKAME